MSTQATVVNAATQLIGGYNNQFSVAGAPPDFDGSALGIAAGAVWDTTVQTVGRQFGWDFSRNIATLATTGNTPPPGWAFEYLYPTSGIQVRQLMAPTITDPNDPLPLRWEVGNVLISSVLKKVIWANQASALAVISNVPPVDAWDPLFERAVIQLLASELAMAVEGKPETARNALDEGSAFERLGEGRYDS